MEMREQARMPALSQDRPSELARSMGSERRGRRQGSANRAIDQLPWSQLQMTLEPSRFLSDDQLEAIHERSLLVLEHIGMDILYPEARAILAAAGARTSGDRLRIGREIVEEALKTPSPEFTFYARNPQRNIRIGGKWIAFGPVGGPPNCYDLDN